MSKVIKGSPFDKAGYTEDTVFRVVKYYGALRTGDLVKLKVDDNSRSPLFTPLDGTRSTYAYLPGCSDYGYAESLEVYTESTRIITPDMLGDVGSDLYEALYLVLKVLDGDEVEGGPYSFHNNVYAAESHLCGVMKDLSAGTRYPLKSEEEASIKQEKMSKIDELRETINKAQEQIEELSKDID